MDPIRTNNAVPVAKATNPKVNSGAQPSVGVYPDWVGEGGVLSPRYPVSFRTTIGQ